jgi:hypothetical protein
VANPHDKAAHNDVLKAWEDYRLMMALHIYQYHM